MNGNMNDESVEDILNTLNVHRERFTNEEVQQLRHLAAKVAYRAKPMEELTKDFRIRITEGACSSKGATREVALMKSTQDKYNASMIFHCLGKDNVELRGVCEYKVIPKQVLDLMPVSNNRPSELQRSTRPW